MNYRNNFGAVVSRWKSCLGDIVYVFIYNYTKNKYLNKIVHILYKIIAEIIFKIFIIISVSGVAERFSNLNLK